MRSAAGARLRSGPGIFYHRRIREGPPQWPGQLCLALPVAGFDQFTTHRRRLSRGSKVDRVGHTNRTGSPILAGQERDFDVFNQPAREERIKVAHASLVEIEYPPGLEGSDVVDFDDDALFAAFHQGEGGLINLP